MIYVGTASLQNKNDVSFFGCDKNSSNSLIDLSIVNQLVNVLPLTKPHSTHVAGCLLGIDTIISARNRKLNSEWWYSNKQIILRRRRPHPCVHFCRSIHQNVKMITENGNFTGFSRFSGVFVCVVIARVYIPHIQIHEPAGAVVPCSTCCRLCMSVRACLAGGDTIDTS